MESVKRASLICEVIPPGTCPELTSSSNFRILSWIFDASGSSEPKATSKLQAFHSEFRLHGCEVVCLPFTSLSTLESPKSRADIHFISIIANPCAVENQRILEQLSEGYNALKSKFGDAVFFTMFAIGEKSVARPDLPNLLTTKDLSEESQKAAARHWYLKDCSILSEKPLVH